MGNKQRKEERTYIIEKIVKQKRRNIMVKIMNQIKKEEKRDLQNPKIVAENLQKKRIKNLKQTKEKINKNNVKIL